MFLFFLIENSDIIFTIRVNCDIMNKNIEYILTHNTRRTTII